MTASSNKAFVKDDEVVSAENGIELETLDDSSAWSTDKQSDQPFSDQLAVKKDSAWSWFVCFACSILMGLFFGMLNSYGLFQVALKEAFNETDQKTAWVGSLNVGLNFMSFPLAGMLSNRMACGYVIMIGSTLYLAGYIMTSLMESMNWLFISYGILGGMGSGIGMALLWVVMPIYFDRKTFFATGVLNAGCSVAAIVFPIIIENLLQTVGWRDTFRAIGGGVFGIACVTSFFVLRTTWTGTPGKGLSLDYSVFKNKAYVIWCTGGSLSLFGYFIPLFFIVRYAQQLGFPVEKGSILITYFGIASLFGRLAFGFASDYIPIKKVYIYLFCMILIGVNSFQCAYVEEYWSLVLYMSVLGFLDGSFIGLLAVVTLETVGDKFNSGWTIFNFCVSIAEMVGPSFSGWMYNQVLDFRPLFFLHGGTQLLGALILSTTALASFRSRRSHTFN